MSADNQAYKAIDNSALEGLNFKELGNLLDQKTDELKTFVDSHTEGEGGYKMTGDEVKEFQDRNKELAEATKRWEMLREADASFRKLKEDLAKRNQITRPPMHRGDEGDNGNGDRQLKTIGDLLTEHEMYKSHVGSHSGAKYTITLESASIKDEAIKASTISRVAGYEPAITRGPVVVDFAVRRPVVADLIPQDNIMESTVEYMEQTTFENNAATVAESGTKPQSDVKWTKRQQAVQVIATYFVVTNQQLDDVPGFRSMLDRVGTTMLQLAEENELLNGNGTPPQLAGFYNKSGVQTQPMGGDTSWDAIYKAMTLVRHTGFAEPTGVVIHPNDWTPIRLATTTDGIYLWGSPSEAGPERIWGKPVIVTTAATENTALTGDFQLYSHISRKMGITIIIGWINAQMISNEVTVRIEERLSLEIYRPSAFAKVTGI